MTKQTLFTLLLAIVAMMWATPANAQGNELWIAGTKVTSANCKDLSVIDGVSGTVKYDYSSNTLTLDNATIDGGTAENIILSKRPGLQIKLIGKNTLKGGRMGAVRFNDGCPVTIFGASQDKDKLIITNIPSHGILVYAPVTIRNCNIQIVSNYYGITGKAGKETSEKLIIDESTLSVTGQKGSIADINALSLNRCAITQPTGAAFSESLHGVALNGKLVKTTVKIEPITAYDLEIAGTKVTSANCKDLSVIDGVSGTVKYDYSSNTLTLDNATIDGGTAENIILSKRPGLQIKLIGKNTLKGGRMGAVRFNDGCPVTIFGASQDKDKLIITNIPSHGILVYAPVTIRNCNIQIVSNYYGITGKMGKETSEKLIIDKSTLSVTGQKGSIADINALSLNRCAITQPTGAAFSESLHGVAINGELVKTTVKIEPITAYDLEIAGTKVTPENCKDLSVIDGVSGTVKYDYSTKTLTLDNATINATGKNDHGIYTNNVISIVVKGTVIVTSKKHHALTLTERSIIKGTEGTLYATGMNGCGIYVKDKLTIESCTVNAKGKWGITGYNGSTETLTIRKATVTAEGEKGSICDFKNVTLEICALSLPEGAAFSESLHGVALNGKLVKTTVKIEPIAEYNLEIAGTKVTSANCNDLSIIDGVSGTVKYDHSTKTLTLDNAIINATGDYVYGIDDMIGIDIVVKGTVIVISKDHHALVLRKKSTIEGTEGTLYATASEKNGCGIYVKDNLTIESCTVNAKGQWGITGYHHDSTETLTIRNATVTAEGEKGSICNLKTFTLDGCSIIQPAGAAYDTTLKGVALDGKLVTDKVVIEPITAYELMIAGTKVTSANCNDLSVIAGVSGTVKYDHSTKTLTLDNATINATGKNDHGIYTNNAINIVVKGTVNVTSEKNNALFLTGKSSINGTGTLYATGMSVCGIEVRDLSIEGCTVHAKGKWGIAGSPDATETLTIRNATVTAEGEKGSICDFKTFTLDGCTIIQPEGAVYDAALKGVALDGKLVTDKVVISPKSTGITSPEAEAETVPSHKKGIYNLQGVRLSTSLDKLPAGIYIVDGKKVIKK